MSRAAVVATLLALALTPAAAQQVQRCESADGRVAYVSGACPPGTRAVRTLPPAEQPSAADRQAETDRARQDAKTVDAVEHERKAQAARNAREQERAENKARKQETHCRRLETRMREAREDLAEATLKKRPEAQRRVRRTEELYAEACGPKSKSP